MRKETTDDLAGARLAWHGQGLKRRREVQLKKEPEVVEPTPQPVEEAVTKKKQVVPSEVQLQATPEITEKEKVDTPQARAPKSVVDSMAFQKKKEKPWLDEKPAKAATRAKRGRK